MTKVVSRKFKDNEDIIALFPEKIWNRQNYTISSYMHIGQHGDADYDHVIRVGKGRINFLLNPVLKQGHLVVGV